MTSDDTGADSRLSCRTLSLDADFETVSDLYERCGDYLSLENGRAPDDAMTMKFFTDRPPGRPIEQVLKLGLYRDVELVGVADLALHYPTGADAYIGLLLLDPDFRGAGLGPEALDHLQIIARNNGVTRLFLAVLDDNPRAYAFWIREGFILDQTIRRNNGREQILHRMARRL